MMMVSIIITVVKCSKRVIVHGLKVQIVPRGREVPQQMLLLSGLARENRAKGPTAFVAAVRQWDYVMEAAV
jgi:hypothetical protein